MSLERKCIMIKLKINKRLPKLSIVAVLVLSTYLFSGCAAVPYKCGQNIEQINTLKLRPNEAQIERGKPNKFLDGLGHYVFSLPTKLILWNWDIENHNISKETEDRLKQYLTDNDLYNVKIRLNQYAPGGEWRRLFSNKSVGAGWRYTFGIISVTCYTAFPGRVFGSFLPLSGGDHYNPYTNTINLYSDHKAVALHEAGHAKDFAQSKYKGTYAFLNILPFVPLYQEAQASGDVIGYDREKGLDQDEKDAYKILYPSYATYIADQALEWPSYFMGIPPWVNYAVYAGVLIPGHIISRIKASSVDDPSALSELPVAAESLEQLSKE